MTTTLRRPPATPPAPPSRAPLAVPANVAVAALTIAAVIGLARLFTQPAKFFLPVAFIAVAVHAVCWACRRSGLGLAAAALIAGCTTALLAAWVIFGADTTFGIPGLDTLRAAHTALSTAADVYRTVSAPAPVVPGFTLAGAVGAATAAFLADWAAFRMRATIEACLPSFSLFVLSAALAQGRGQIGAGAAWLGALLLFLLVRHAAVDTTPTAWFASRGTRGAGTVLGRGAVLGALAVGAAAAIGPSLPGATVHPLINWRHHNTGDSSRTIGISPLVDITARLQSQSHEEVFTVASPRPEYWRLTSLDHFENNGWSLQNEFSPTGGRLDTGAGPSTPLRTQFKISALSSIWLPAAFRPTDIAGVSGVSFSSESSSLITAKATSDGLSYTVNSAVPAVTPAQLAAAPASNDPKLARDLQLPALPPQVTRIATTVTAGATTPYAKAKALQDYLRSPPFRYDLNVAPDDSPNALLDFLTVTRAGFCQQFAAGFAVLARSIGLPTRVAVGFTDGQIGSDGLYHVTDAEAHAWPEVYFTGIGWVAFEPTPGRGSPDPSAQAVTGVPPAQDTGTTSGTTSGTGAPATSAAPAASTPATTPTPSGTPAPAPKRQSSSWVHPAAAIAAGVAAALLVWIGLLAGAAALVRRRRASRARSPGQQVDLAWTETTEALADAGVPPHAWETPAEFAHRAADALPAGEADDMGHLARAVEVADYAPGGAGPDVARATNGIPARVRRALRDAQPWWSVPRRIVDPRPAARLVVSELDRRR